MTTARPPHRTAPAHDRWLHVVDLDSLVTPPRRFRSRRRRRGDMGPVHRAVVLAYARAAGMTPEDHAVLLDLDASLDGRALDVIAPCGWLGDQGPVSLTPEQCAARYERVVVGSGSARVVPWVDALTTAGMSVTVVHRPGLVAPMLAAAADALVPLPRIGPR